MERGSPPSCFSREWEEDNAECKGGLDPLFLDDDGGHKRPGCTWYRSCGEAFNTRNSPTNGPPLIPVHNLTRPFQPPTPVAQTPWQAMANVAKTLNAPAPAPPPPMTMMRPQIPTFHQQTSAPVYAQPQPTYQQQQQHFQHAPQFQQNPYAVQMVAPQYATVPQYVPMNYAMPGAQVPSFITVPESPEGSWKERLLYSLVRGMAKAAGLIIAGWFDHNPIKPWGSKPPQSP